MRDSGRAERGEKAEEKDLWESQQMDWRRPEQVAGLWRDAGPVDPRLLRHRVRGEFWEALAETRSTLLVTREYEHLAVALRVDGGRPCISYMPVPHPSGVAFDGRSVHMASTRNPNNLVTLEPVSALHVRGDASGELDGAPLVPVASRFLPGSLYLHDLAIVGGALHGNAVGWNAVVRLDRRVEPVWWPRSVERRGVPDTTINHLQLNSIAAGADLSSSFFTASAASPLPRKPGDVRFPVDRTGVVFSGATREPCATGLTRPHSARLHTGRVYVCDSGYGVLGVVMDGRLEPVVALKGWTRGLAMTRRTAFVGTSRVISRFRVYAPGLDMDRTECGVHAVDVRSGDLRGSLVWPAGYQIFSVEAVPSKFTTGFPFVSGRRSPQTERDLFYSFVTGERKR